jgi:RNA polymerase sigma factor (sigma-70 family)
MCTVEELEAEATVAVWRASQTYREDRAAAFGTYVGHCVFNALNKLSKAARATKRQGITVSTTEGENGELPVVLVSGEAPADSRLVALERRQQVREAVDALDPRLKDIIERRFWLEETRALIAERYGLTRARIQQLEVSAFDKLRPRLRSVWVAAHFGDAA